jgi:hypothetical protein
MEQRERLKKEKEQEKKRKRKRKKKGEKRQKELEERQGDSRIATTAAAMSEPKKFSLFLWWLENQTYYWITFSSLQGAFAAVNAAADWSRRKLSLQTITPILPHNLRA